MSMYAHTKVKLEPTYHGELILPPNPEPPVTETLKYPELISTDIVQMCGKTWILYTWKL